MKTLFFKPDGGWSGDYIPFHDGHTFRLFYLLDKRTPGGHRDGIDWACVETNDFIHFTDHGVMLPHGSAQEQDRCVYTGSVIRAEGRYHIFYTGHNPFLRDQGLPEQKIMHAVSDDLEHWTKLPEHTFGAEPGYEMHDWRDPFVFADPQNHCYHMLIAARLTQGPAVRRGCTGHLTSTDLIHWTVCAPFWAPDNYYTHECPDFFRMGQWYYLIFSEFTDRNRTRYVMSRSPEGPWLSPADDVFDTRAYYAAKSWSDGDKRYLFGWNPTRVEGSDSQPFHWGGNLVVHELYALENGELAQREPATVAAAWQAPRPVTLETGENKACLSRADGMAVCYAAEPLPKRFRLTADFTFEKGVRTFGVMLHADKDADTSYALNFEPAAKRMDFVTLPQPPWQNFATKGLDRVVDLTPGVQHHLTLLVDDTMMTAYVDDRTAFSTRMYDLKSQGFGVYAQHGSVAFEHLMISTELR